MYRFLGSTNIEMYTLIGGLGFLFTMIYNFFMFRHKRNLLSNCTLLLIESASKKNQNSLFAKKNFWTAVEIFIISSIQFLPSAFFNLNLGKLLNTGANYFGLLYFIPFVLFIFFFIISVNPFRQTDLITPAYPLALIFTKLACFCDGCCGGFACEWGLMNYHYQSGPQREFPTQLVEAGLALIIFLFLLWYRKKAKEGTLFPIYLIIYSATRFFSEFTSNKPDILWHLKTYHILCIIGVILGTAELILVLKYSEKIKPFFERSAFTLLKKKQSSTAKKKYPVQKKKK
ncbi:MAG: prolipoprotein diacylglyceryl transferase [Clostridia bacterium]|nr:prolipoprotein diacylglyceryl transferase [Clostridia bacterium]